MVVNDRQRAVSIVSIRCAVVVRSAGMVANVHVGGIVDAKTRFRTAQVRPLERLTHCRRKSLKSGPTPSKKGLNILDRIQVSHMAQMQNILDFPPAPKLTSLGHLDPEKANESERRGAALFFGKAQCAACHPAPSFLDNQMHDLHLERFLEHEAGDDPIKNFTLRGIKDSPPYLHDGRYLTLEDTVEFFNLVLALMLSNDEKKDLVTFMRQL